jgi:hypothetical protein
VDDAKVQPRMNANEREQKSVAREVARCDKFSFAVPEQIRVNSWLILSEP